MTVGFGQAFWRDYLGYHVLQRYSSDILSTGSAEDLFFYFFKVLLERPGSWYFVLLSLFPVIYCSYRAKENKKEIKLFFSRQFFFVFFSLSATKLHHYIFPFYTPFSLIKNMDYDIFPCSVAE
ncbi:MAG: hypothetical protein PHI66_01685 [Candidatus Pacebacteria bacterium]|nr:hypothetical protein [Candidatus Paceibacterota bacterium]